MADNGRIKVGEKTSSGCINTPGFLILGKSENIYNEQ